MPNVIVYVRWQRVAMVTEVAAVHTLEESAAAEQAKRTKVALEEVEVKTGEEDEYNVFQVSTLLAVVFLIV